MVWIVVKWLALYGLILAVVIWLVDTATEYGEDFSDNQLPILLEQ